MRSITSYQLPATSGHFMLALPRGGKILGVHNLNGELRIEVLHTSDATNEHRNFVAASRNSNVPEEWEYIGHAIMRVVGSAATAPRDVPLFLFEVLEPIVAVAREALTEVPQ